MKKIIILLLAAGLLWVAGAGQVNACSCVAPPAPQEALEQADAVFSGRVVDIQAPKKLITSSADPLKVTFEVSKVWKGPKSKKLVVVTARDSASCGYSFKSGRSYIVYAHQREGELTTSICTRTKLLSSAEEDLAQLGTSTKPTKGGFVDNSQDSRPDLFVVFSVGGIIIVALVIAGFLAKKNISNKQDMALNIKWQRLVDHSETCERCASTEEELDKAVSKLKEALSVLDTELNLEKERLTKEEFKNEPTQSNQIIISGKPLEEWLAAEVGTSECCDTCKGEECRTIKFDGDEYEVVPSELIVKAGLIAAGNLGVQSHGSSGGCGCRAGCGCS